MTNNNKLSELSPHDFNIQLTKYEKLREFHTAFGHSINDTPTVLDEDESYTRFKFMLEEIIELLYATARGDKGKFSSMVFNARTDVLNIANETIEKGEVNPDEFKDDLDVIIGQVDALIDNLYFTYGTLTILGIDPDPIFDIVHNANMKKLGEDGKPIIRESDGKFLKPDDWVAPEPLIKEEIKKQLSKQ